MINRIFISLIFLAGLAAHAQNMVNTYAGNGTAGFINGDTASARFKTPFGICMDKAGNLYVADAGNNCIRKITATGTVTTLAGTGAAGYLDGAAASAQFNSPTGVCVDDSGNVYVADFQNQRIRKISVLGNVTTVAGSGTAGYLDGSPALAQFNYPRGICRNKAGDLFVGDSWNHRVRKISPSGNVSTYAGGGTVIGVSSVGSLVNAKDTAARFYTPCGMAIDKNGNLFVADAYNHRIRRIDTARQVSVVAGSGSIGVGNGGYSNGPVSTASLNVPTEVNCDSTGAIIYIGDTFSNRVRMVSSGNITNLAGSGLAGYVNGIDVNAQFNYTRGVVANASGTKIYVVDYNNHCVRKISVGAATSVKENENSLGSLSVFPNPNNGIFRIKHPLTSGAKLRIRDAFGREIYFKTVENTEPLDLSGLENGLYFAEIRGLGSVITCKFIKN